MSSSVIGQPVTRIDGRLKVTGGAAYAVEHPLRNVAHGVGVASTIGKGRIVRTDSTEAEKMPGVLAVLYHGNSAPLYRPAGALEEQSRPGESRPPFEDENVYYYGQFVALVIAETFEQAQDAAAHVHVEYDAQRPLVRLIKHLFRPSLQRRNTREGMRQRRCSRQRYSWKPHISRRLKRTIRWRCTA